jgi:alkylation response protein AidB-like acyl-CoA dehydrogenase
MINLTVTSEQEELISTVARAAGTEFPRTDLVRACVEGTIAPIDDKRWRTLAELGLFSLSVPEAADGLGLSLADEVLVLVELGRVPARGPWVGTMLATRIAAQAGQSDLAGQLMAGEARAGVINGDYVVDAGAGEYGVRVTGEGGELVRITAATPVPSSDEAAIVSRVESTEPVASLADPRLLTRLRVLTAAYMIGVAESATDMSAEYAKVRHQFDRPIGSFQAVKHRCSEMAIRAYSARAELYVAALLLEQDGDQAGVLEGTAAYLLSMQAARRNVEDNVQNHGGIGVTAEHDAGVLVKRAQIYSNLGGGSETDLVPILLTAQRTPFN